MLRRSTLLCGLFVLLAATAAWSQDRPDRGPRGFRGFARPVVWELLRTSEVQKELSLADDQKKPIDELQEELQTQTQASFAGLGFGSPDEDREEREKRMEESRKKLDEVNKQAEAKLEKILKKEQLERLTQLRLQREGAAALARPEIADQLKLTKEQKAKVAESQDQGFGGFGPPRQETQNVEQQASLTDDQKAKWTALVGKKFEFPELLNRPGFGRGPGGPGGFGGQQTKLVEKFDKDDNGWLNAEERKAARASLATERAGNGGGRGGPGLGGRGGVGPGGPGRGGPGGGPGGRGRSEPGKPGPHVAVSDVTAVPDAPLYAPNVLRTVFLEFENKDWEAELADFHNTDVDVAATMIVDGQKFPNVGVRFRGMSSYGMVPAGSKRSFNVSVNMADAEQRLYGYKTLNLLNSHEDDTFLHTVLYSHVARQYIPAPKANFVKVVINGESWGVYVNAQQFDKVFLSENYESAKGTRWKVRGNPGGGGGLDYVGDKVEDYKRRYQMKSEESAKAWQALITLCRTLKETPPDKLEAALEPMLDIDGTLWFLALDNALINSDGYWIRASDYAIYRDKQGKFHVIPHDMNETFAPASGPGAGGPGRGGPGRGGPGGGGRGRGPGDNGGERADAGGPGAREGRDGERGGPDRGPDAGGPGAGGGGPGGGPGRGGPGRGGAGGSGYALDPLIGLNDNSKPLRSRLLAVPKLRARYLEHVGAIAQDSLDWQKLGPVVAQYRTLIEKEIEADTRKLSSYAAFQKTLADGASADQESRPKDNLFRFAEERRKFLLEYKEPSAATNASAKAE